VALGSSSDVARAILDWRRVQLETYRASHRSPTLSHGPDGAASQIFHTGINPDMIDPTGRLRSVVCVTSSSSCTWNSAPTHYCVREVGDSGRHKYRRFSFDGVLY
jgi:hypothetical protein